MTKKCLWSALTFTVFTAVCLTVMHLMLLVPMNKWIGVSCGVGVLIINLTVYMFFFRKSKRNVAWLSLFSAVGCGLAISSMYVHLGVAPTPLQSLAVWGALVALFFLYCFMTNIPLLKRFPRLSLLFFLLLTYAGGIVGICLSSKTVFSLVLLMLILFTAFLITIAVSAASVEHHSHHLTTASFIILFIVIIVVLIVLSQGDIGDGLTFDGFGGGTPQKKKNPYDFTYNSFDFNAFE